MGTIGKGIPTHCRCGERVRFLTSRTSLNSGRPFHACPHGDEKNRCHLFKWTDESMFEEIEEMKPKFDDLERTSSSLEKGLAVAESAIEKLTMETKTCEIVTRSFKKELEGVQREIQDCKMELKSLKNMVVFVVAIVVLYKFVM